MVERFSLHCREALVAAEREARSLRHRQIGTEHVLLGLRLLGLTRPKARRRIVRLVDVGVEPVRGPIPFISPRVREILEGAFTGSLWVPLLGKTLVGPSFEPSSATRWGAPVSRHAPRLAGERHGRVKTGDLLVALIAHGACRRGVAIAAVRRAERRPPAPPKPG